MRILLIEDDEMIADAITRYLRQSEFRCDPVRTLRAAQHALRGNSFDAVILDLNLPDGCGLSLLKDIRKRKNELPVVVLTARNTIVERVTGLDLGADDYLSKPFDLNELLARVRAVHRRAHGRANEVIEYNELAVHPSSMTVVMKDTQIHVPVSQFRLLQYLVEHSGKLRTKEQIIDALYSWDDSVAENTIEVYVSQLRKLLWPDLIKTVRGVGYMVPSLN